MVARLHEAADGNELRRLTAGHGQRRHAIFERGHALLQNRRGGVHDARINVPELLQAEQLRRIVRVLKDK